MQTQLYFWKPLMERHKKDLSMVKDYYDRTKGQFGTIEQEATEYSNSLFNAFPGGEDTDVASVAEWATEKGIEMYETLTIMKSNHLLMTISMLYHIWEQQLIRFTINELQNNFTIDKKAGTFDEVQKLFKLHGVDIITTKSWGKIRELKALVNTVKHGDGDSADRLRKIRPDFFVLEIMGRIDKTDILDLHGAVLLDAYSLQVKEDDLYDYIRATKEF